MNWIASTLAKGRLLILAASVVAGVSLAFSSQVSTSPLPLRSLEPVGWTAADFDGDNQPDLAISEATGRNSYILDVRLSATFESSSRSQQLVLSSSPSGLHVTAQDVDGDHDLDIVITVGIARQTVAIWINDGQGRFAEGDLASFPTWNRRGGFFSLQLPRDSSRELCSEGRRYRLALVLASGLVQRIRCIAIFQPRRRNPLFSCPANKLTARAPPYQLSVLS
jgi:hypothetical protein